WRLARADERPRRALAVSALFVALLVPAVWERADDYGWNTTWMRQTQEAIARDRDLAAVVDALDELPPGRVYAGLSDDWQKQLDLVPFNSVRIPDLLNEDGLPRMAKPYASLSLDADLAFSFDPNDRGMWDLFNVRYAVARTGQSVPAFLVPFRVIGKYTLYTAPTSGWTAFARDYDTWSAATDRDLFFQLRDTIAAQRTAGAHYTKLAYPAATTTRGSSNVTSTCYDGRSLSYERMQVDRFDALLGCPSGGSLVILKVTYHPNWRVTVDDRDVETFMVSPGFIGFDLGPGMHFVTARYTSTPLKSPLVGLGFFVLAALVIFRRALVRPPWTW
ncbi:MAG TPA: hypothetical protein VJQ09_08240, partial [Candidatus Limnocylindria bacterium]|nr:hypothetical protein [Candidatus Limnocylindria bacterium]